MKTFICYYELAMMLKMLTSIYYNFWGKFAILISLSFLLCTNFCNEFIFYVFDSPYLHCLKTLLNYLTCYSRLSVY